MAFTQDTFAPIGAQSADTPKTFSYRTIDSIADIQISSYFIDKKHQLTVGDRIYCVCSDGTTTVQVSDSEGTVVISSSTIKAELLVSARSPSIQNPSTTDTPLQVEFGAGESHPDVTIDGVGNVTFHTAGTYNIALEVSYGRTGSGGAAIMLLRGLVDGFQVVDTVIDSFENANSLLTVQFSNFADVPVNAVLTAEIMRDSGGADDGGLFPYVPAIGASWNPVPSASMVISRLVNI